LKPTLSYTMQQLPLIPPYQQGGSKVLICYRKH